MSLQQGRKRGSPRRDRRFHILTSGEPRQQGPMEPRAGGREVGTETPLQRPRFNEPVFWETKTRTETYNVSYLLVEF